MSLGVFCLLSTVGQSTLITVINCLPPKKELKIPRLQMLGAHEISLVFVLLLISQTNLVAYQNVPFSVEKILIET